MLTKSCGKHSKLPLTHTDNEAWFYTDVHLKDEMEVTEGTVSMLQDFELRMAKLGSWT